MGWVTQKAEFSISLTCQYSLHILLNAGSRQPYPCHVFTDLCLFSSYSSRQFHVYFVLNLIVLFGIADCLFLCFYTFLLFKKECHPNHLNLPMILPFIPQKEKKKGCKYTKSLRTQRKEHPKEHQC